MSPAHSRLRQKATKEATGYIILLIVTVMYVYAHSSKMNLLELKPLSNVWCAVYKLKSNNASRCPEMSSMVWISG